MTAPPRPRFVARPPFAVAYPRGRARRGLKFQRAVDEALATALSPFYLPSPWLRAGRKLYSPDGLYINPLTGDLIVFECKLTHTPRAADQLRIYARILARAFDDLFPPPRLVEVVRFYDCAIPFPRHQVVTHPLDAPEPPAVGVWIYHPGDQIPARRADKSAGSRVPARQESPREPGETPVGSADVGERQKTVTAAHGLRKQLLISARSSGALQLPSRRPNLAETGGL